MLLLYKIVLRQEDRATTTFTIYIARIALRLHFCFRNHQTQSDLRRAAAGSIKTRTSHRYKIYIFRVAYPHKKRVWRASNNIIYISECERAGYRGRQSLKSYVCFEYAAPHNIRILPLVAYRLDAYASEYIVLESVSDCTHPQRILYSI